MIDKGYEITVEEMENFIKKNRLKIEDADGTFFYRGVSKLWLNPEEYSEYYDSSPGIGYGLSKWINKNISIAGSETPSSEVIPPN